MGYYATPDTVDVSNANTPGEVDPTNPVAGERFVTVRSAGLDEVLRGVSFTPGTRSGHSSGAS